MTAVTSNIIDLTSEVNAPEKSGSTRKKSQPAARSNVSAIASPTVPLPQLAPSVSDTTKSATGRNGDAVGTTSDQPRATSRVGITRSRTTTEVREFELGIFRAGGCSCNGISASTCQCHCPITTSTSNYLDKDQDVSVLVE
jgi:hypothetical protein